jgi:hypothetical protein
MHGNMQVFKMVFVVVGPIEICLFMGKLAVVELKLNGIQVKVASAVAGRIAGLIFIPFIVLTMLWDSAVLVMGITATVITAALHLV